MRQGPLRKTNGAVTDVPGLNGHLSGRSVPGPSGNPGAPDCAPDAVPRLTDASPRPIDASPWPADRSPQPTDTCARRACTRTVVTRRVKAKRPPPAGDRGAPEDLGLLGRRERSRVLGIDQARNFYASALARPNLAERLGGVGITPETLAAGLARVEAVAETRGDRQGETADATRATASKDTRRDALDRWAGSVARAEFGDEPERLDRLGLWRTVRGVQQRAAHAPAGG